VGVGDAEGGGAEGEGEHGQQVTNRACHFINLFMRKPDKYSERCSLSVGPRVVARLVALDGGQDGC
jgi:hypothetical protein